MNEEEDDIVFAPLDEYDYTYLGAEPEEWLSHYVADIPIEEVEYEG